MLASLLRFCSGKPLQNLSGVDTARAVIAALSAFFGTVGGVTFQYVLLDAERDFSEIGSNAAEYLYRTNLDFTVWYEN